MYRIVIEFNGPKGWEVSRETETQFPDTASLASHTEMKQILSEGYDARLTIERVK